MKTFKELEKGDIVYFYPVNESMKLSGVLPFKINELVYMYTEEYKMSEGYYINGKTNMLTFSINEERFLQRDVPNLDTSVYICGGLIFSTDLELLWNTYRNNIKDELNIALNKSDRLKKEINDFYYKKVSKRYVLDIDELNPIEFGEYLEVVECLSTEHQKILLYDLPLFLENELKTYTNYDYHNFDIYLTDKIYVRKYGEDKEICSFRIPDFLIDIKDELVLNNTLFLPRDFDNFITSLEDDINEREGDLKHLPNHLFIDKKNILEHKQMIETFKTDLEFYKHFNKQRNEYINNIINN